MKNKEGNYQGTAEQDFKPVLDLFNNASTSKEIEDVFKKNRDVSNLTELSESIIAHRNKLGGFTTINQLTEISGLGNQEFSTLFFAFEKPTLPVEEEILQQVMWIHGTSIHIEKPEVFSNISRNKNGTRITGFSELKNEYQSFVHYAIPTPTFSSGNKFYIRSIFVLWRTSFTTQSLGTFTYVTDVEVLDGHQLISSNPPFQIIYLGNGYIITKLRINSSRKINFGVGVSFNQVIDAGDPANLGWVDYVSLGVEFVTRSNSGVLSF
ncbi:helix-hairpin-helix domain-containing protein [uncultured Maribacter sp.]|uniref:helix-hairpin-helix domain-containing protein n=1 Tax=uncultured Maribacter sp. TaxID=431308 RepID=UPI0030EE0B75|tara:strand:+ start:7275 stop:8072 length:798 start_codon:yes stop_codon:yes gene_type:complete